MNTHQIAIAAGFLFVLNLCDVAIAQQKTEVYTGLFKGKDCEVTINWADYAGLGGVEGKFVVDKTAILTFTGEQIQADLLKIDIQGQAYSLRKEVNGNTTSWVGNVLSFSKLSDDGVPGADGTASLGKGIEKHYNGYFRGDACTVTLIWGSGGGLGTMTGTLSIESGSSLHLQGGETRAGFIELEIESDPVNHKLNQSIENGKTSWVGDYLSITEIAGEAAGKGMATTATGAKPASILGAKPPGALGTGAPGLTGTRPLGAKPPGTLGAKPPRVLGVPAPVSIPAPKVEDITLTPKVWPVGKWPEGMAHDGNALWVAESGQRNLAQINPDSGAVMERVSAGRLPVGVVSNPVTGDVFAAVATDQKVVRFSRSAKGGAFASLSDYPNSIAADETAVWVLMWVDGSNAQSKMVRYDQKTASTTTSGLLGSGAWGVAKSGNALWTNHTGGTEGAINTVVSQFDPKTLKPTQKIELAGNLGGLAATEGSVFVCGGNWDVDGVVVRIDPGTLKETARKQIPGEFSYRIAADADYVVVAGAKGTLSVFSADDLALRRTIHLDWKAYQPSSLLIVGEVLYVAAHEGEGENGSVLVVNGWAPVRGHP